ncbi:MAG: hypothetical protein WD751_09185 [Anaerolineales bacterium]
MGSLFTPKGFLQIGGAILLLVGLLGMFGILIGPTAEDSIFGAAWYFDPAENIAHTALGVVGIAASFVLAAGMQKTLVMLLGVVGILVAVYNIFSTSLLGATLQSPADLILHAVVGAWALYASMKG